MPPVERLMTVREWAAACGISPATAYRRIAAGEIKTTDVGSGGQTKTRIRASAHADYIAARTDPGPRTTRRRAA